MFDKSIWVYLGLSVICFLLLKISIWPAVLVFPYLLYKILKKAKFWISIGLFFIIGLFYFYSLFLWATTTGIELNLFGGVISGIIFATSALGYKLIERFVQPKFPSIKKIDFVIWPLSFYTAQQTLFPLLFVDATYLLDVPPFLTFTYHYIGSGGMHTLLLIASIIIGYLVLETKTNWKRAAGISLFLALVIAEFYFQYIYRPIINNSIPVAIIQGNHIEDVNYKAAHAEEYFDEYKKKIYASAYAGAKMIILPENGIFFFSLGLDSQKALLELQFISDTFDTVIIFATLERNETKKMESRGYVIRPDQKPDYYVSQRVYDYIGAPGQYVLGTETKVFETPYGTVRLLICFEGLFRDILKKDDQDSYDHIVIMADNQFLPSERGLTTLEWNAQDIGGTFKKDVIYASNTGPTAHINGLGQIVKRYEFNESGILWTELAQ